jgi:hypothetical protein
MFLFPFKLGLRMESKKLWTKPHMSESNQNYIALRTANVQLFCRFPIRGLHEDGIPSLVGWRRAQRGPPIPWSPGDAPCRTEGHYGGPRRARHHPTKNGTLPRPPVGRDLPLCTHYSCFDPPCLLSRICRISQISASMNPAFLRIALSAGQSSPFGSFLRRR